MTSRLTTVRVADRKQARKLQMPPYAPPRLDCALGAAEVQGSRKGNRFVPRRMDGYTFLTRTLRPIRRTDKTAWRFSRREYHFLTPCPAARQPSARRKPARRQ